jgi:hypothetical protein
MEFSGKITSVTIKDKKSIPPDRTITSMLIKDLLKLDYSECVVYLSSFAYSDHLVRRKPFIIVPRRLMYLSS